MVVEVEVVVEVVVTVVVEDVVTVVVVVQAIEQSQLQEVVVVVVEVAVVLVGQFFTRISTLKYSSFENFVQLQTLLVRQCPSWYWWMLC